MDAKMIRLGTHGEDYGSWMSSPVFFISGAVMVVFAMIAILAFAVFRISLLGWIASGAAAVMLAFLAWIGWIRYQFSTHGGAIMDMVHQEVLSRLGFSGKGRILDVGCGSGALSIRAALTWPDAEVVGIDSWGSVYAYSKAMCERNAESEGVGSRCIFLEGDASSLDFPDEGFDAVVSNYVYHNIVGSDKHDLLLESLRVLRKGGVFALNDDMKPRMYGDMEAFAQRLRDLGYADVRIIDTASEVFGSRRRAAMMMLGSSCMIAGRK